MTVLLAWLGNSDFRASEDMAANGAGSILGAAKARAFTAVHVLFDHGKQGPMPMSVAGGQRGLSMVVHMVKLRAHSALKRYSVRPKATVRRFRSGAPGEALTFHLSPGTPTIAAVCTFLPRPAIRPT